MAIQPTTRIAGSSYILRFQGNLVTQATAGVQTQNGEVVQGALADVRTLVKFALADMTNLNDRTKRLPSFVYDDSQPAGASPHSNSTAMGPSIPPPPLVGVPAGKTYGQSIRVRAHELTGSTAAPRIAQIEELFPVTAIDGAAGTGFGLEQNTGVPVVGVFFHFTAAGIAALAAQPPGNVIPIILEVEVPHSMIR
jgi:hypothetical protein